MSEKKKFHSLTKKFGFESKSNELESDDESKQLLEEDANYFQHFIGAVDEIGDLDLRAKMKNWEKARSTEIKSTLEEEEDSFQENMLYREIMCASERSKAIKVKTPKRQFEWKNEIQTFTFHKKIKEVLKFEVEDNCRKSVATGVFEMNEKSGKAELPLKVLKNGRYYLKIFSTTEFLLLDFYIKNTKPSI